MSGVAHELRYRRLARKATDGADGLLFVHVWPTGFQFLVFDSRRDAAQFEARLNAPA